MRCVLILMIAAVITVGCTRKYGEVPSAVDIPSTPAEPKSKDTLTKIPALNETNSARREYGEDRKNIRSGNATDWEKLGISGRKLDLIHDSVRQTLVFNPEGDVMAVFGTKGGAETAPILFWELKEGGLILSSEKGSPVILELREPRIQGSPGSVFGQTLSVVGRDGREVLYKLSRAEH